MGSWWFEISLLNKIFAAGSVFFGVLFVWQIVGLLVGLQTGSETDSMTDSADASPDATSFDESGTEADIHAYGENAGGISFSLVSLRSLIAFGTLFTWAGTLYLASGASPVWAILYAFVWGVVAMFGVSYLVYKLVNLQEIGNVNLWDALGEEGLVYIRIPPGGVGKVRVMVGETISYVNAVSRSRTSLEAGAPVRVVGVSDAKTLEVNPLEE